MTMVVVMAGLDASLRPFKGGNVEEVLEDRISRCWRTKPKIGIRCPGACRYMPSCTLWCGVLSGLQPARAWNVKMGVLMHLLVLGAF